MADAPHVGLPDSVKSIPPMVWVGAVGVGLAIAYYLHSRQSSATNATANTPTVLTYTGTGGGDSTANTTTGAGNAPTTNAEWATAAKNYLLAAYPSYNAIDVSNAIDNYVGGAALTSQQNAMVSQAIQGIGAPPETLPPTTGGTTQTTYSWENPISQVASYTSAQGGIASGSWYVVAQGDTLVSIATKAYGIGPGDYASMAKASTEIYNYNAFNIADMKNLTPGTKLYIPVLLAEDFPIQGSKIPIQPTGQPTDWFFTTGEIPVSAADKVTPAQEMANGE